LWSNTVRVLFSYTSNWINSNGVKSLFGEKSKFLISYINFKINWK